MTEAEAIAADLKANGQLMTLSRTLPATADSETVTQKWGVYGITSSYNSQTRTDSQMRDGSSIMAGDKKAILAAVSNAGQPITPLPSDRLTFMREVWYIVACDTVAPQGVNLLHNCQVRK